MNGAPGNATAADTPGRGAHRPRLWKRYGCAVVAAVILVGGGGWLCVAVREAREAALASCAQCPLNQLQLALHNYHDTYGCFPPAHVADSQGRPMHSWRVLLLPLIDQRELYEAYRFDEPWNGPHNAQLADRMPEIFHIDSEPESRSRTNIVALVGPGTAFPGAKCTRIEDFADGLDNTILLAEIAASDIAWLEPRDLDVREMSFTANDQSRPSISSARRRGPYVVLGDSVAAHSVSSSLRPETLRALTTIAGREPLCLAEVANLGLTSPGPDPATDESVQQFRGMAGLHSLWLNHSNVTDAALAQIAALPQLRKLHLRGTRITDGGLTQLRAASELVEFDLANTHVSDAGLPHLAALARGHSLSIDLRGTRATLSGVAQVLASLPEPGPWAGVHFSLKVGTLSQQSVSLHGPTAGDAELACLRGLTHVTAFHLTKTRVTARGLSELAHLPALRQLYIWDTPVSGHALEVLGKCTQLDYLSLHQTGVTDAGVEELRKELPGCRIAVTPRH